MLLTGCIIFVIHVIFYFVFKGVTFVNILSSEELATSFSYIFKADLNPILKNVINWSLLALFYFLFLHFQPLGGYAISLLYLWRKLLLSPLPATDSCQQFFLFGCCYLKLTPTNLQSPPLGSRCLPSNHSAWCSAAATSQFPPLTAANLMDPWITLQSITPGDLRVVVPATHDHQPPEALDHPPNSLEGLSRVSASDSKLQEVDSSERRASGVSGRCQRLIFGLVRSTKVDAGSHFH